ncbi:MAG: L-2-hydroxyglutarate oxidase [Kiritimatiellae bacterium]|nr:L-2-hydroxyglutarate oxidase [Kiritimatiellia bacterium]MDW8457972.1 L-2-hydroxyglutarate oxidase [Verrucomicrobiota bacterium]
MPAVLIIGGGIVGLATGLALAARPGLRVVVAEAESELAAHQTGHNSGVIHSGLYYKPGSLKAQNCTRGREAMYRFCAEYGIPHERCGKVVVAVDSAELPALEELERRGRANGLDGIRRLGPEELREIEPHAAGVAALFIPQTGIVDFRAVAIKMAELILEQGSEVRTRCRFLGAKRADGRLVAETTQGPIRADVLVNCGGLQSDRVARLCGVDPGVQIVPFRGEYYELVPDQRQLVRNLIYPVPDPRFPFLGVHFTRMINGKVEAGPNAVLAFKREGYRRLDVSLRDSVDLATYGGFWRMAGRYWRTGLGEFHRSFSKKAFVRALQRLMPEIREEHLVPAGAGVRAQAVAPDGRLVDDFHIVEAERMVHVLNAPSPAATSSLSIGMTVAEMVLRHLGRGRETGGPIRAAVQNPT